MSLILLVFGEDDNIDRKGRKKGSGRLLKVCRFPSIIYFITFSITSYHSRLAPPIFYPQLAKSSQTGTLRENFILFGSHLPFTCCLCHMSYRIPGRL